MKILELLTKYKKFPNPIFQNLLEIMPDEGINISVYVDVYFKLLSLSPKRLKKNFTIFMDIDNKNKKQIEYDMYGVNGKIDKNTNTEHHYILYFVKWRNWLECEIDNSVFKNCSELDFIGMVLYSMTTFGFDEKTIMQNKIKIKEILEQKRTVVL